MGIAALSTHLGSGVPAHSGSGLLCTAFSHHEHINLGQEKLQKAMDTALTHEKAQPLFDKVRS